ncbi:MAG TPA: hypothetical protein VJZ50_01095 [Candidatus Limnocylindrales bacterium]|nr:hypothetical protein [Candidatus Limnocylindrales bacterium]
MDGREASSHVRWEACHPLDAQQAVRAVRRLAVQQGGHGVGEGTGLGRVHTDLGRQLGCSCEGHHRPLGKPQPLIDAGHGGGHVGGREVAQGSDLHTLKSRRAADG